MSALHDHRMLSLAVSAILTATALSDGPALAQSPAAASRLMPPNAPLIRVELRASKPLTAQQLCDLELRPDQWNMKARLPPDITRAVGVTSGTQTSRCGSSGARHPPDPHLLSISWQTART